MYLSPRKKLFVDTAAGMFGDGATITKAQKSAAAEKAGVPFPTWFGKDFTVGYNAYNNGKSDRNQYGKTEPCSCSV